MTDLNEAALESMLDGIREAQEPLALHPTQITMMDIRDYGPGYEYVMLAAQRAIEGQTGKPHLWIHYPSEFTYRLEPVD